MKRERPWGSFPRWIGGVDHPSPAGVGGDVLEGGGHAEGAVGAGPAAGDLNFQSVIFPAGTFYAGGIVGLRSQTVSVELAEGDLGFPGGPDEKDVVGLEREKEGGAGFVLAEGDEAGPVWAGGGGDDEEGLGGIGEFGEAKGDGVVVRARDQLQRQGGAGE